MKSSMVICLGRAAVAAAALVLAGCASTYVLDSTVQSFSQLQGVPAPATYRFERLPSQQDANHARLEAIADGALSAVGLKRDDRNPHYSVEVSARTAETLSPWADPWGGPGWGGWGGWGRRHRYGVGVGFGPHYEPSWYHREVNVIVRDLGTNKVVYESRAVSDAPYLDPARVFPAMFQAALQGFPNPPAGPRVVNIPLPG